MNIKPMNDTGTIQLSIPTLQTKKVIVAKEHSGLIPNTVYRIIKWERLRLAIMFGLTSLIILACTIAVIVYSTVIHTHWMTYILPSLIGLLSFWKWANIIVEHFAMKRSIEKYEEDLRINLSVAPAFISRLYVSLHKRQVTHNWFSFVSIFYGGIITLLLWWLKNTHWWIFKFDKWIHAWFANPDLMTWIFAISLITIALMHIVFAIQRKKRILDIESYFGEQAATTAVLEEVKTNANKMYRRLFIISLMVLLVIPLVIRLILKLVSRRK